MQRLTSKVVLSLVVYLTTVFVLGRASDAIARLLWKIGSPELWTVLHQHPFGRAILVGLVAGLIPLELWLSVSGFFSADIPEFLKKLELEEMKAWAAVFFSPFMFMAFLHWVIGWHAMHSKQLTVLSESSSMPLSKIFEGFFSANCRNVSDVRLDLWSENFEFQCSLHILWVSIFLTAVGYSLAPWIRARLQPTQMSDYEELQTNFSDEIDRESELAERIEEK